MHRRLNSPELTLFAIQRLSGALLALLLLVHLVTIIYAVQGGLSVMEIVERVRGNRFWFLFYGLFVATAVTHAAIGLRKILAEWTSAHRRFIDLVVTMYFIGVIWLSVEAMEAIW